ncbi:efflux RND transporter permease subunit [Sediminispirochaeta smaragdinae]|uniref:SSD domain-containing protein n=1 Tax=Sediminispirochaeta smaragdinae (strain DSM 11293 / JCM 15392 / SEBR 4228) TaxID=573413 RepID=E1RAQ2_SEDSS|nr:MMPL family transporter [Sediminispirochaeta smaragdinae]ADK82420.1 conserved hypothetical protein [Sediminispirochaeta smaragdinae DSM 11293]
MQLHSVNSIFRRIGTWLIAHRWLILLFMLLVSAFGFSGLNKVAVTSSNDEWFNKADEIEIATDRFEELFGNNDTIALLVESDDVFQPYVLQMIREIGNELLLKVPYADEITSLTELDVSVGTEEGIAVINPVGDEIPQDPQELAEIKELVLSREALVNKIVSADAKETWISLSLKEYPDEAVWKAENDVEPMYRAGEAAIAVVTDPKWESPYYTIKAVGMPYTETEERDFMGSEAALRVGTGFIAMALLLLLFLRSLRGLLVPLFTTIAGIALVYGIYGWIGTAIDANMMTLPVLLGMALAVGYSIHLINTFKRYFRETGNRKKSVITAVEETGWPIFFTAVTTMGSVLSFSAAGIIPIRWLGFTCAAVVGVVYLYVIILTPILLSFGKDRTDSSDRLQAKGMSASDRRFRGLGEFVIARRKSILFVFIIAAVLLVPGVFKVSVNIDSFEFMGLRIPYIKRVYDVVNSQLGSYISYNVTVDFGEQDAVKDPDILKRLDKLIQEAGGFELTKKSNGVPKIYSILDIVKEMNRTLHEDDPDYYQIPENREMVSQLLFLYELSGGTKTYEWIDENYSILRAQIELSRFDANEIVYELDHIRRLGTELFPHARVDIVGSAVRFAAMNEKIVIGELKSFLTALCVIGILLALVFGSLRTGLIGMIPNITPIVVIGGVMGYFGFSLDMMTMTIMPMLLGIAVDDTIHFINHIKYEFERGGNYHDAILISFRNIGKTLAMTTVILSASFAMYIFSPVNTLSRVGILAVIGLTAALAADYLMTPILIYITKPFGKETADRRAL